MKIKYFLLVAIYFVIGNLAACKNDKAELLYPIAQCDTSNVKYSTTVLPILSANCYGCHAGTNPTGALNVDSYTALAVIAENGQLLGSLFHSSGFYPMPKNAEKLNDCSLAKIKKWVDDGFPNN